MNVETKKQYKTSNTSSIEDLYRLYHHKLIHFFTGKGLEPELAEDLSQEVFFRYLRNNKSVESGDHARNLLYRIAQNLVIDHFRKHNGSIRVRALSPEDLAEEELPYLVAEEMGPEDRLISDEISQDICSAVSRLPLRYAQAIMLKEYDGLSYREIAAHMGVSQKAVESLLHRAKSQLKEDLAETGRQRGGWWSGILLGLHGIKERAAMKPLRALARLGSKLQGMSLGLGSVGMGKGVLNLVVVLLMLGSVVGTGVAATVSALREAPEHGRMMEDTPAAAAGESIAEAVTTGEASDHTPAVDNEVGAGENTPVIARTGPALIDNTLAGAGGLLSGTGDTARGAIVSAAAGLDLLLADLGQLLGALCNPLAGLLFNAGMPPQLLETLAGLTSLEAARDLSAGLVGSAVEATYILDETAGALSSLPTVQLGGTASAPEVSADAGGAAAAPPDEPAAGDTAGEPASSIPAAGEPMTEPPAVDGGGAADAPGGVEDLLETVTDILDNLLPF